MLTFKQSIWLILLAFTLGFAVMAGSRTMRRVWPEAPQIMVHKMEDLKK